MGIFDLFLRFKKDPTRDWPAGTVSLPEIDQSGMLSGPLKFGCNLQQARFFGKPDKFTWKSSENCELLYARSGFQIEFECDKLDYVAFFIGPDEFLPDFPGLSFSQPVLKDKAVFNQKTTREFVRQIFGTPVTEDVDADETIMTFSKSGIILEFEFNPTGYLKRWNLFPEIVPGQHLEKS